MTKFRGFLLRHRVTRLNKHFRCIFRRHRSSPAYCQIPSSNPNRISRLFDWTHRLKNKAKSICWKKPVSGYQPIGVDPVKGESGSVPKGKMAVYVGQEDGEYRRVLVPVIYINHPLFGQLLIEAEKEYGYNHPGGITIPCRISEFERVKTRIQAAGSSGRKILTWK